MLIIKEPERAEILTTMKIGLRAMCTILCNQLCLHQHDYL